MTSAPPSGTSDDGSETRPEWGVALGLFALILGISVVGPWVLVGLPFIGMALLLPVPRKMAFLFAALGAFLVFGGGPGDAMWHLERGWSVLVGGIFVGLTMYRPGLSLTTRSLAATGGGVAVAAALFALRPGSWDRVDFGVRTRLDEGVRQIFLLFERMSPDGRVPPELESSALRTAEVQGTLFPALLCIATVAALALAWWLFRRLAHGEGGMLRPVREFRFDDHLVWLFIAGLALVAFGVGEGWSRVGSNAVVFMGALYALRGVAIVLFLNGGLSLLGAVVVGVGMLYLAPLLLAGALLVGLSDTWLDVRSRIRSTAS